MIVNMGTIRETTSIFFMIVCLLVLLSSFGYLSSYRETFITQGPLMWTNFNEWKQGDTTCPRAIAFSKFAEATYHASLRSQLSGYQPSGACTLSSTDPTLEKDYALVEENTLTYVLKSLCLNLSHKQMFVSDNMVSLQLIKVSEKMSDLMNIIYLYVLNPVYIEVENSAPYVVDRFNPSSNILTNYKGPGIVREDANAGDGNVIAFLLRPLIPQGQHSKNAVFMDEKKPPQAATKPINMRIYYLDNADATGRRIEFKNTELKDTLTIFDKNYASSIIDKTSNEYYFNQRIYMLLTNSKFPVVNIKFDIHLNTYNDSTRISGKNATLELMRMYMENPDYNYFACPFEPLSGTRNNNILSVVVQGYRNTPEAYKLSFVTGKNKTECNYHEKNQLEIELPYVGNTERISILLTITPYSKMMLAQWVENGQSYFKFKRNDQCDTNNNFAELFSQGKTNTPVKIDNILMKYDNETIKRVHYIHLGHLNYMDEFNM